MEPVTPLKLKVEINTREHFSVLGTRRLRFEVGSPWFEEAADIVTYEIEELLSRIRLILHENPRVRHL